MVLIYMINHDFQPVLTGSYFLKRPLAMFRFTISADKNEHTTRAVFSRQRYVNMDGIFQWRMTRAEKYLSAACTLMR